MSAERLEELRAEYNMNELEREVRFLRRDLKALSIRVNQLERAHNRLAHLCGGATKDTIIDRDNWEKV